MPMIAQEAGSSRRFNSAAEAKRYALNWTRFIRRSLPLRLSGGTQTCPELVEGLSTKNSELKMVSP